MTDPAGLDTAIMLRNYYYYFYYYCCSLLFLLHKISTYTHLWVTARRLRQDLCGGRGSVVFYAEGTCCTDTSYPVGKTQLIIPRVNAINLMKRNPERVNNTFSGRLLPKDLTRAHVSCISGGGSYFTLKLHWYKVNYSLDNYFIPVGWTRSYILYFFVHTLFIYSIYIYMHSNKDYFFT